MPKLILKMDTKLFQKPDSSPSERVGMPVCITVIIKKGRVSRYTFFSCIFGVCILTRVIHSALYLTINFCNYRTLNPFIWFLHKTMLYIAIEI